MQRPAFDLQQSDFEKLIKRMRAHVAQFSNPRVAWEHPEEFMVPSEKLALLLAIEALQSAVDALYG